MLVEALRKDLRVIDEGVANLNRWRIEMDRWRMRVDQKLAVLDLVLIEIKSLRTDLNVFDRRLKVVEETIGV